ncbi:MAG TPA: sigma-54 dependent transcriptional regulator [Cytophagales bacterium]|nr:sigma-54 dependent transcriptional regulator [Cytophagales bacterium]
MKKILIVDDNFDICNLLSRFLSKNGFQVSIAHNGAKALGLLAEEHHDLVLCDFRLEGMDGEQVLTKIKEINPSIQVIIITGYSDIKVAVKVVKLGAYDYITKPLFPDEILHTINKALEIKPIERLANDEKKKQIEDADEGADLFIIGNSEESKELYRQIDLVAPTNYSVIIFGESGTGKESVAKTIHNRSSRKNKPFIAMDCGAISKELYGSELFGHEKGAFTGAISSKIGHFELANGGTLFLDEVANLPYEIQVSLLRVVQERKMKKIGGSKEINLDVRIIVATNENLFEAFQQGKFREDLYHRFNEFTINLPPLRERNKDIMIFADYFLKATNRELNKKIEGFDDDVTSSFLTYNWPGNIRELKNVIRRAALLTDGSLILPKSLPVEISNNAKLGFSRVPAGVPVEQQPAHPNLKNIRLEAEYEMIKEVLKQVNYNKTKAAKILKIDRKTLYNKMNAYNILG